MFEQGAEPSPGTIESPYFSEQMFDRPIAGIVIHVSSDLVAQALAPAAEKAFEWRGKREIALDQFCGTALSGEVVAEDSRDVSSRDLRQRRIGSFEYFATRFIKWDVATSSSEIESQSS